MNESLKVVMLAAGWGTRLGDFGKETPKGLISNNDGQTLAGKCIDELYAINPFIELTLITNDKFFTAYSQWIASNYSKFNVTIINDGSTSPDNRLGALGDLWLAVEKNGWHGRSVLALPSDTWYSFPLIEFIQFGMTKSDGLSTVFRKMELDQIKNRLGCGTIDNGRVVEFVEKPDNPLSPYAAIPFYFYKNIDVVSQYLKDGNSSDAPGSIIPWMIRTSNPVYGYITESKTLDVGTMKEVNELWTLK